MKSKFIACFCLMLLMFPIIGHAAELDLAVNIINTEGAVIGEAIFSQVGDQVQIKLTAKDLTPGEHGIHIHEKGICEAPEFKSAGEHFNPVNKHHGFNNPKGPHGGDLPNILVGKDGKVETTITTQLVTLEKGKANSLFQKQGTSLVIHEKADDYKTDPAGNSGARIGCAVIAPPAN